ncbi:MAG: hypothetical protein JXR68_04940 [Bacteroidales bacterium]|nr:hypothetical protein [Bacteroidales bacterium]
MKINNLHKADKFRFYFPMLLIFSLPLIGYSFFAKEEYTYLYGVAGGIALIVYILLWMRKPHYFNIETKYNEIIVKFYNTHIGFSKPKSFQIKNSDFNGYSIIENLGGFSKSIVFQIKKGKKVGSYPPISISLLSKNEIKILENELNTIIKTNKL